MTKGPQPKKEFDFTLVYNRPSQGLSERDVDALYEAGCDDALVGECEGEVTIDFSRQAPSFRAALLSAISDVECSGVAIELIRVETESPDTSKRGALRKQEAK